MIFLKIYISIFKLKLGICVILYIYVFWLVGCDKVYRGKLLVDGMDVFIVV